MKSFKILFVIVITVLMLILLPVINCQLSEVSTTALDIIGDGIKAMFGFDQMVKTFRRINSGVIPFPFFVPILPKSEVIKLLKGRKPKKEDKPRQISDSSASASKISVVAVPPPLPIVPFFRPIMKSPNYISGNNYMPFYNMRPTNIGSDIPIVITDALRARPPLEDDIKSNVLDFDYMQNELSNGYSERYESGIPQDLEEDTAEGHNIETPVRVIHNWDTIDDELRGIGHRLGKLGHILHKN